MKIVSRLCIVTAGCLSYSGILSGCSAQQAKYHTDLSSTGTKRRVPEKTKGFTITNLGTLGGKRTYAHAINDSTQIVGQAETKNGVFHAFVWQKGQMADLGAYPDDYSNIPHNCVASVTTATSGAVSINSKAQIVGKSEPTGEISGGSFINHAVMWEKSQINDLGTELYTNSLAKKINDRGQIIGEVVEEGEVPVQSEYRSKPFLYQNGQLRLLNLAPESVSINNKGEIVGVASSSHFLVIISASGVQKRLAGFAVDKRVFRTLINDSGQIVVIETDYQNQNPDGYSIFPAYSILWRHGKKLSLNGLKSYPIAEAKGMNNQGDVVGEVRQKYMGQDVVPSIATLWRKGIPEDLNGDIPKNAGWLLQHAEGINNTGQIIGSGKYNGEDHAFLLTPLAQ